MSKQVQAYSNDPEAVLGILQGMPPTLPSSIRGRLTMGASGVDRWSITGPLTATERAGLERSAHLLGIVLGAAEAQQIKTAIVGLLVAFPAGGSVSGGVAAARTAMYEAALAGLPLWAIRRAAERFMRGEIERDNHTFAPSPPEWAKAVQAELRPFREQAITIGKVLGAEVEIQRSEAEVERRKARVAELLATFTAAPNSGASEVER